MAGLKKRSAAKRSPKKATRAVNRKIDEQVEETFPASDPPAFVGGKHIVGAPKRRETPAAGGAKKNRDQS